MNLRGQDEEQGWKGKGAGYTGGRAKYMAGRRQEMRGAHGARQMKRTHNGAE